MNKFVVCFLFVNSIYAQTFTGKVQDTLKNPLQNANVIAIPKQEKSKMKFAIADYLGRYRLELEKEIDYDIKVSYIGFKEQVYEYKYKNLVNNYDFILKHSSEQLKEVIITHKFQPIEVKKDTVTYQVSAFTSGNERKLGEQLEKLPGVEVSKDGAVTFQGKKVSSLLIDNKPFFGGGTKLGVQNIPANAVDKAEFIDHFNEVGFMKEVSDSEKLALNIKLKKDKKKFIFGDAQAGFGIDNFYNLHTSLFYYSPKFNIAYIGDTNNFGQRVFTFDDLMRFQGGYSSFINGRKNFGNLWSLSNDQKENLKNESLFNALNLNYTISDKIDVNGYVLFSKTLQNTLQIQNLTYLQTQIFENRTETDDKNNRLFASNLKFEYSPKKETKWFYNFYNEITNNSSNNNLITSTNIQNNTFQNLIDADNISIRQYLERHQKHNQKNTTTFVISYSFDSNKPHNTWLTNKPFFNNLIPLQTDSQYQIEKLKKTTQNKIDVLLKHYWTIDKGNHLYTIIGTQLNNNQYITDEKQILSTGQINDFSSAGFGNDIQYNFNDFYSGLEYKFRFNKWINKPMIYAHLYSLSSKRNTVNQELNRLYLEPQWLSEYEFNDFKKLTFNYVLKNSFPTEQLLADRFTLQSFNNIFKGNALINNERFHQFSLRYYMNNLYKGWMIFTNASYINKTKNIRNTIVFDGINQFSTPILFESPETNWMIMSNVSKRVYRFNLALNTTFNGFSYLQELDKITTRNDRNSQLLGLNFSSQYNKWPNFNIGYTHGFNQLKGLQSDNFQTQNVNIIFDYEILDNFIVKFNYDWNKNIYDNRSDLFDRLDLSFEYKKKNNPWLFELKINNALNTQSQFNNNFSDFLISTQQTFILPRVAVFMISYKL